MNEPHPHNYEFGDFRIDATKRQLLRRDGEHLPLTPRVFDTLLYFVCHAGKVLEKDELMREIWPDTVVEENNLNQNVSTLRRVLGESRGENRYIVTVPGRGYRFAAEVRTGPGEDRRENAEATQDEAKGEQQEVMQRVAPPTKNQQYTRWRSKLWPIVLGGVIVTALGAGSLYLWRMRTATAPVRPIRTIAVLPFKPLAAGERDEALELGMADTLVTRLSNIQEVVVSPISSVRKYGGLEQDALAAGRELGVESVLDGTIQRSGDRIRVTARLVRVSDGRPLWIGKFDEDFTNIFEVQDSLSSKVVESLRLKLTSKEQQQLTKRYTDDTEAYQLYLIGRFYWNKRTPQDYRTSIKYFEQAIALDPNYAPAFAGLADAYALLANAGAPPRDMMPRAREAARKALLLDDNLAEAHTAMGQVAIYYDYDFAGAEREYQRAIELNPNYATARQWYSELLTAQGRHEEALDEMRRALKIEPLSLIVNRQYGVSLLFARRYDEAIAQLKKTIQLDEGFPLAHSSLSLAYRLKGDYAGSVEELARYEELIGEDQAAGLMRESFAEGGWRGFLRAMTGERRPPNFTPYILATFHAALGEEKKAFAELDKAYQSHDTYLGLMKVDPRLDSLRDDPRFEELSRKSGLLR